MNILILTSTFPANPQDITQHPFQLEFIKLLKRGNHDISVLTHARGDFHEKVMEDIDIVWFPWRRIEGRLAELDFFSGRNILSLLSLIYNGVKYTNITVRRNKIQLVICLWVIPSGFYVYVNTLFKLIRVPYILWALGSDINKYKKNVLMGAVLRQIIRRAYHVYADGFELCSSISSLTARQCEFLPTFRKVSAPAEFRMEKRKGSSFLFVGRHHKIKGLDTLIDAVIHLEHSFPDVHYNLTVVGDGELTSQMKDMIDDNGLGNKVTFTGKIADARLYELYSEADCVIIPSRSESIPLVFSESLQFNKPMIVTDVGDMGVLGRRYGVARVVEKENAAALAKGMEDFMEKPFQIDSEKRDELLSLLMMENSMQKLLTVISESGAR